MWVESSVSPGFKFVNLGLLVLAVLAVLVVLGLSRHMRGLIGGGKNRLRGRTDPEQGQGQQSGRSPSGIGVFEGLCLGAQALCKFNGLSVPLVARGTESLSCYEV